MANPADSLESVVIGCFLVFLGRQVLDVEDVRRVVVALGFVAVGPDTPLLAAAAAAQVFGAVLGGVGPEAGHLHAGLALLLFRHEGNCSVLGCPGWVRPRAGRW